MALAGKRLMRLPFRVWVLCGDSEIAEGSQWEALEHAVFYGLDNLIAIWDVNRLGQRGETMHGHDLDSYANRARAFGCHAIVIDGHDLEAIDGAYAEALAVSGKPVVIIARTIKGKGAKEVEDKNGYHGKPLEHPDEVVAELGGVRNLRIEVRRPDTSTPPHTFESRGPLELPQYELGAEVATRKAYGEALAALGKSRGDIVALDGEVSNSTYAEIFRDELPDRYFEMYIAEQQLIATAVGMQALGFRPFASTFGAFLSRAYDFIRMSAISRANYCIVGSHAGIAIGEDGPSQMALEDIASIRAIHGSTVLHPCDANQTAKLVAKMADTDGIVYLRTLRSSHPGHLRPGRGLRDRRLPDSPRRRRRRDHRLRRDRARSAEAADALAARRNRSPRDRPLFDQAARRDDAPVAHDADRDRRGSRAARRPRRSGALGPGASSQATKGGPTRRARDSALRQARRAHARSRHRCSRDHRRCTQTAGAIVRTTLTSFRVSPASIRVPRAQNL